VPQAPVGPLVWATFSDTAFLNPGQNFIVELEQISASFSPGGPILIDGKIPDNTGRNLVLDGSFTSRGYPEFYNWEPTDGSNSPIWGRLGRGGVRAWYQNYLYGVCWGGWPGRNGPGFTSVILGANDAGQFGAIVGSCGSLAVDYGDGIPTFGTYLVRYRSGVGLELRTSPPSNLVEPVMLGPNAEMHSLTVANNTLTLVKLNADTTPAWTKTVTGAISSGSRYDVDAQGNIFIIFGFSGSVNFGAGPLTAVGVYSTGFVKLDPMGNVIWQKRFDAPFSPNLARAGSADAAISGLAMPSVDLGAGPVPGYFIAKFSSSGSLMWTVSGVIAFGLTADPLGGVYTVVHVGGGGYNPWNIPFPGRGIGMIKYKECPGPLGCKAYGASCSSGDQCGSGICADGVCCDGACSGTCSACTAAKKGYGEDGACQAIAIGNDPDAECIGGVCNGSGKCALDAGAACTENIVCSTGFCVNGVCCNEACSGICQACTAALKGEGSDGTCGEIAIGTDPANECAGGTCSGTIGCSMAGNGAVCTSGNQCASGHCADGICCDSACSGTCDACTAAKKGSGLDGACGPIANGSDPDNECVNGACDGASTCRLDNAQICSGDPQCLSGFCVDGYCCNNSCNGTCVACSKAKKGTGQNGTCGNIVKGTDPDAECGGLTCSGVGDCLSLNGETCSTSAECASNYCRDGVCCNTACNGTCLACSAAKKGQGIDGTCEPIASGIDPDNECPNSTCDGSGICTPTPCMANNECPSGICSNGFCAGYILDVEVNQYRSCAIFVDGTVKCWGNAAGLGLNASNVGDNANEMGSNLPFLPMGTGRIVKELGCGYRFQCALTTAGQVVCWGYNDYEQLGRGDQAVPDTFAELGDNLQVVNFGAGRTAIQIASGGLHSCAVLDNGDVKCWGYNAYGQLGYGDTVNRGWSPSEMGDNLPAVNLGTGRTAIAVSVEEYNSCALLDNGAVKCWGTNGAGQLGQGDTITRGDNPGEMGDNLLPINLGTGKTAVQISLGRGHACVRLNDQSLKCWGNNIYGALGLGTTDARGDQPGEMGDNLPAINLGTGRIAVDVNAAEWFTCALLDDSTLKCWGAGAPAAENGTWSNLGDQPGEMGDNLAPVNLGTGKTVIRFSSRWAHSCAVLNDGSVKCWGYNINGQLGLGNTANTAATGDNLPAISLY
jgi:alpha-tubulin suppressor-like RCC1 family protein